MKRPPLPKDLKNEAPAWLQRQGVNIVKLGRGSWGLEVKGERYSDMCSRRDAIEIGSGLAGNESMATRPETYETAGCSYHQLAKR